MDSSRDMGMRHLRFGIAVFAAMWLGGCMMQSQSAPAEVGPSSYGWALTITATPDVLPRDGSSQSTIRLNFRDGATNQPLPQRRIVLATTAGSLSAGEVITDANGNASAVLTAPSMNSGTDTLSVTALPISDANCLAQGTCAGNADNSLAQFVRLGIIGPAVPAASFTYLPTTPTAGTTVTFDASGSTLSGAACGSLCGYLWDFGDNTSGAGSTIQHIYQSGGVKNVTLLVLGPAGTSNSLTIPIVVQ